MYICLCHGVSGSEIDRQIESGCKSLRELAAKTSAGTSCGVCIMDIRRKLQEAKETETSGEGSD